MGEARTRLFLLYSPILLTFPSLTLPLYVAHIEPVFDLRLSYVGIVIGLGIPTIAAWLVWWVSWIRIGRRTVQLQVWLLFSFWAILMLGLSILAIAAFFCDIRWDRRI